MTPSVGKDVQRQMLSNFWWQQKLTLFLENNLEIQNKILKIFIVFDPGISLSRIHPKEIIKSTNKNLCIKMCIFTSFKIARAN